MLICGLVFTAVGIIFTAVGVKFLAPTGFVISMVFLIFGLVFLIAGIKLICDCLRKMNKDRVTIKEGHKIPNCKIIEYGDDCTILVNGVPLLEIICLDLATQNVYRVSTGTTSEVKYPIGSYVNLYELNGYVTLDKNSIRK